MCARRLGQQAKKGKREHGDAPVKRPLAGGLGLLLRGGCIVQGERLLHLLGRLSPDGQHGVRHLG